MNGLRTGYSRRKITPPSGSATAGYFEPHYATEIVNDLFAEALVFEVGGELAAVVDCDVIGLGDATVCQIREKIAVATPIPAGNVLVSATHTHTGPYTQDLFGGNADQGYLSLLTAAAAEAVREAFHRLQPSVLKAGVVNVEGLDCNRRVVLKDGTVHTHLTDADLPEVEGREGPVDQELGVIEACANDGSPIGMWINFALHPTNVRGERICTDYPGYLSEFVRSKLGGNAGALFANGPCGNIDSKTPELESVPYGPERARWIARQLTQTALSSVSEALPLNTAPLVVARECIRIPRKKVSADLLERAKKVLQETEPRELFFTRGTRRPSPLKESVYANEAVLMAELTAHEPDACLEVQAIRLGDFVAIGFPVELFCEYGLEVKRLARERFNPVFLVELANGCFGYVPTRKSFEGGGYETRLARSSQLAPEAGEMLVDAAARLLKRVDGEGG